MPAQRTKSLLASKAGKRLEAAHEHHKNDETTVGAGGGLPAGIEMGIAQLVDIRIGEFKEGKNKGEPFFIAAGVVLEPKDVNGVPIRGERTQIGPEALCDTPDATGKKKTFEDHYAWVLNEVRKLGLETAEIGSGSDLEESLEALKEAKPCFRFRTWAGQKTTEFPNPRVNHDWRGVVTDYHAEPEDQVKDETAKVETNGSGKPKWEADEKVAESTDENGAEAGDDLDALANAADNEQDQDSINRLEELAKIGEIDYEPLANWQAVADAIKEKGMETDGAEVSGEAEESETEAEEVVPEKEQIFYYKPPKARKTVECEVTAVFDKAKKVNLKNMDDNKTIYKSVSWSELKSE